MCIRDRQEISWNGIILTVTGIALGMVIYQSGAAEWLAVILLGRIVALPPLLLIFALIFLISLLKVGLSSNTVTATVIVPIVIAKMCIRDRPIPSPWGRPSWRWNPATWSLEPFIPWRTRIRR